MKHRHQAHAPVRRGKLKEVANGMRAMAQHGLRHRNDLRNGSGSGRTQNESNIFRVPPCLYGRRIAGQIPCRFDDSYACPARRIDCRGRTIRACKECGGSGAAQGRR